MSSEHNLDKILFLDIETVPEEFHFKKLDEKVQSLWAQKFKYFKEQNEVEDHYQKAGIYAEFSKVVCISVGIVSEAESERTLRIKSFYGHDEKELLTDFAQLLEKKFNKRDNVLCAHNGKEFDFPFLCRRMLINKVPLPQLLKLSGKKPWEIPHHDTLELWKFGDIKNYTSLSLLAYLFNIPTSKDDIDGSEVASVYWEEKNLPRIVEYCQKDVIVTVQLYLSFKFEEHIKKENIQIVL